MTNRKNIKVSSQTYNRLDTIQSQLEAICETKLSQDKTIQIVLCGRSLENQLLELMLEDGIPPKQKRRK